MLQVHALTLGAYQVNCYIIHDEKSPSCCVIDPGYEADTIVDKLSQLGLTLEAILLTHGHFDHVGAVRDLAADTGCQVWLCADDLALPTNLTAGPLCYTNTYAEGTGLHLAGLDISVLQTPGHTPGSVCLLAENTLFSGDTLFAGSCGRTDLPGGSWEQMQSSLKRLAGIEANLWVLPGHGESTMLASEKKYNPYLR
ncbi:MAG: MBL fold metallo-hydrolase [Clostridiales bacterium]|nr:MBL fold metallo-hydrolase [Clostridiales bacterium]